MQRARWRYGRFQGSRGVSRRSVGRGAGHARGRTRLSRLPRENCRARCAGVDRNARCRRRALVSFFTRAYFERRGAGGQGRRAAAVQGFRDGPAPAHAADAAFRLHQRHQDVQTGHRRRGRSNALVHGNREPYDDRALVVRREPFERRDALCQRHEWRAGLRLCEGRKDRPHDADRVRSRGSGEGALEYFRARQDFYAAAANEHQFARSFQQIDRLFEGQIALSDEAGRLRSERCAQSAKSRHFRLRAHHLGRGARYRRFRNQADEDAARQWRDPLQPFLAPYLGQSRLLPLLAVPVQQCDRHDQDGHQSRQLGGLVLGRHAPLRLFDAQRRGRALWTARGLPRELRIDGVLVVRPRGDDRQLCRPGRHDPPSLGERGRDRDDPHRPLSQFDGRLLRRQVDPDQARHGSRARTGDHACLDRRRALRQGLCRDAHDRLRRMARTSSRRGRYAAQDAGMAGERDRRAGLRRARARAQMGRQAHIPVVRRQRHDLRRRQSCGDRRAMGAFDGALDGDAGVGQARRQFRLSAIWYARRSRLLFSRLCGRRLLRRRGGQCGRSLALPAHAASHFHEFRGPARAAPAHSRGDPRRQDRGLSDRSPFARTPVREIRLSGARPFARAHDVQVRRLAFWHVDGFEPAGEGLSIRQPGVRRQPVDLERGRGSLRGCHPARLHQFRALGHQRMGGGRRLQLPQ